MRKGQDDVRNGKRLLLHIKANNWYRSKVRLDLDAVQKGSTAKVTIGVNVNESGFGYPGEWSAYDASKNLAIDLKKGGKYETGFGL